MTDLLRLVAEPRRQEILRLVWTVERSAGDIARAMDDVTFGAVSQHLRALREGGLVSVRTEGRHRYYRAQRRALGPVARYLATLWQSHLADLRELAELEEQKRDDKAQSSR